MLYYSFNLSVFNAMKSELWFSSLVLTLFYNVSVWPKYSRWFYSPFRCYYSFQNAFETESVYRISAVGKKSCFLSTTIERYPNGRWTVYTNARVPVWRFFANARPFETIQKSSKRFNLFGRKNKIHFVCGLIENRAFDAIDILVLNFS